MKETNNSNMQNKYISQHDTCDDIELVESTNEEEAFITGQNNFLGWMVLIIIFIMLILFL
ncbi:hypothetical protein DW1_1611 [Proteiniborus sp. DW1]|uniref:hypothetical protein n=1 Tax=Proteiniborus sp. DW1 TaxID=1889883 RepID=UPI00092DF27F|nr:hypothetical protein [Proteiniborus sp. DW1]SCG83181.1 hypothetical protein DW1_1611 [Proteiniborus sp. DW1]